MSLQIINRVKLSEIAPVFNLIQKNSACCLFNPIYLIPYYQAGLAIQLFSIFLFNKIRLANGHWHKANLNVIHKDKLFVGFILTLIKPKKVVEIYMCAVESQYRKQGFGKNLIQSLLNHLNNEYIVEAECLPKAFIMKKMLVKLGFKLVGGSNNIEKFIFMPDQNKN